MQESEWYKVLTIARETNTLARDLERYVDRFASSTGTSHAEVVKRLGEAAGIQPDTVRAIMRGQINDPPNERILGFAQVLAEFSGPNQSPSGDRRRPASFEDVWSDLRLIIGKGEGIRTLKEGKLNRFSWSETGVEVITESGKQRLPRERFEATWELLTRLGILKAADLPEIAKYRSAATLALFSQLPYIDYTDRPVVTIFLTDHIFTNGQLSDVFGVSNAGGIRYTGSATDPKLIVFITGAAEQKSDIPYVDHWENGRFLYTGEGLRGDQSLSRGNRALETSMEKDVPVFGFEKLSPDRYKYLDRFRVVNISTSEQPDSEGQNRHVFVFHMEPITNRPRESARPVSIEDLERGDDFSASDGERLDADSIHRPTLRTYRVSKPPLDWNWSAQMRALVQRIEDTGFVFEPWEVAAYVTALRTKPFVILAGISGTGKSKLPRLVASACGFKTELIPVRPDWTDSSDLLGYSDLSGAFRPGRLLELAREAENDLDTSFTVVLDEMNLARVEHYFAEVLSRVEEREVIDGVWFCTALAQSTGRVNEPLWSEVGLPPNLALVGTVNMDESTHGFSRKVLDRAFTLELSDVKLSRWGKPRGRGEFRGPKAPSLGWPASVIIPERTSLAEAVEAPETRQVVERVIAVLERLNSELKAAQLQVGYRVRDEIALFVINAMDVAESFVTHSGEKVDPLDLAIAMKVLPRIIGGNSAIRRVLTGVLAWSMGRDRLDDTDAESIVESWREEGRPSAMAGSEFPRCSARLCLMWERLVDDGFTSYWL